MTIAQAVIAYFIAWWLVLLMAAPIAAQTTTDENRKKVWIIKLVATTFIAGFVTWGMALFLESGVISVK